MNLLLIKRSDRVIIRLVFCCVLSFQFITTIAQNGVQYDEKVVSDYSSRDLVSRVAFARRWVIEGGNVQTFQLFRNDILSLTGEDIYLEKCLGIKSLSGGLLIEDSLLFNLFFENLIHRTAQGITSSMRMSTAKSSIPINDQAIDWKQYFELDILSRINFFSENYMRVLVFEIGIIQADLDHLLSTNTPSLGETLNNQTLAQDIVATWRSRLPSSDR